MKKKLTAIYPGSFDPVTNGHLDIIQRSRKLFDRVIVAVLMNVEKDPLFSMEERLDMLGRVTGQWNNVEIDSFEGLLVNYAAAKRAQVVLRSIRAVTDYEYEVQMALMNRRMQSQLETVFMVPAEEYSYLSSSLVKEIFLLGGSVRGIVPEVTERLLKKKVGKVQRKGQ